MDRNTATSGLHLLCDTLEDGNREIAQYPTSPAGLSDEHANVECPVFDAFYIAGGSDGIMKMTNFTLWSIKICGI